jgi:hypothetical protein
MTAIERTTRPTATGADSACLAEAPQAGGGAPPVAKPQKEHEWLHKLVGTWAAEMECSMGPGQPTTKGTATETVRSIGGLWVVAEGQGDLPGCGPATMMMSLGFDPQKGRFVGTFIGSMMTHLWIYDGALDASGRALILDAEGPNCAGPADGKLAKYQDIIEWQSDDRRVLRSRMLGEDGTWREFMTAQYRRTK